MMHYFITSEKPDTHFINIKWTIPNLHQDIVHVQLPSWRPGRYELQHYAKNLRDFTVANEQGNPVAFRKVSKDRWEIDTAGINKIEISYAYFANQPDAGASYVCEEFLYLNPVNALMYVEGRMDEPGIVEFGIPEHWEIATQLPVKSKHLFSVENYDFLADSPLIASGNLEHYSFQQFNTTFHMWFEGKHTIDPNRLLEDTRHYAEVQHNVFGELPCEHYHFLYLMLDKPFRHGVEHLNSTVIAMGISPDATTEEFYNDLLAISSHELFHLWNVKRIRPEEMLPYDFTRENYSHLGYVYEGVTTYYGDLFLLRSGVWNLDQYLDSLQADLKRHFDNEGRFHYSVAESSWDTWLDGYVPGIPGRKVSIYIEGLIAALVADIMILKNSKGKYRLDQVLNDLYHHDYKSGKGYNEARYQALLEQYGGCSFVPYFKDLIWGKGQHEVWLRETLVSIGLELQVQEGDSGAVIRLNRVENQTDQQKELFGYWIKAV
jgi:predicted metalloprotease with PDZ domain